MQPQRSQSSFDQFANMFTRGNWSIYKWILSVFLDANYALLAVFLRKNMGRKMIGFSNWFFGASWLTVLFIITTENYYNLSVSGKAEGLSFSGNLFWIHSVLFAVFCIWRAVGAWINLRRSGQPGVRVRHTHSIGESVLYPIVRFILKRLWLIDDEYTPRTLWKMNEDRWMQFWEPLIIILFGYKIGQAGFTAYGNFIILAAICLWYDTFQAYNNTAKVRQAQMDASVMGNVIEQKQLEDSDRPHIIGE